MITTRSPFLTKPNPNAFCCANRISSSEGQVPFVLGGQGGKSVKIPIADGDDVAIAQKLPIGIELL